MPVAVCDESFHLAIKFIRSRFLRVDNSIQWTKLQSSGIKCDLLEHILSVGSIAIYLLDTVVRSLNYRGQAKVFQQKERRHKVDKPLK